MVDVIGVRVNKFEGVGRGGQAVEGGRSNRVITNVESFNQKSQFRSEKKRKQSAIFFFFFLLVRSRLIMI